MVTADPHPIDALVSCHTPLVSYAVLAVAPRLPDSADLGGLAAAGLAALRAAADSHTASGRDDSGFAAFAKPRITAALAAAVAGSTAEGPAAGAPSAVADLLSHMESVRGNDCLLAAAHPTAFTSPSRAPQVGHYAAVAAASDFRNRLESVADQQPRAAQLRAFGA